MTLPRDEFTGRETTGHEWDGIRELDTPLPKWWLYLFYSTILWSAVYCVLYPAIPGITGHTDGVFDYNSREDLASRMQAADTGFARLRPTLAGASYEIILRDPDLRRFAQAGGAAAFADNCAPCHGAGGAGQEGGYPVLADDAWIWGGTLDAIETTILHGVRWDADEDTRVGVMPAFGDNYLEPETIDDVTEYVLAISGGDADPAMAQRGETVFVEECSVCHAESGKGMIELGAPDLTDAIWLYGGLREDIRTQIAEPRHGVMPAWGERLDDLAVRMLTVYVHTLGGGW